MKDLIDFIEKNFMWFLIIMGCFIWCIFQLQENELNFQFNYQDNYEIRDVNGLTLLFDKKEGFVWRNVQCNDKDKIPNCWELMMFNKGNAVQPKGYLEMIKETNPNDPLGIR